MQVLKNILINRPASEVWKVVAEEFDQAHLWMGMVKDSYAFDRGAPITAAPVAGRVCVLGNGPNGLLAEEIIIEYNEKDQYFVFDVVPKNAGVLPIKKNTVKLSVVDLGGNKSKVLWASTPDLKPLGKLLSPVLKLGLSKNFGVILKDLKNYCESPTRTSDVA